MAFELGIFQPAYAIIENGKTALTVKIFIRILQILNIRMDELQNILSDSISKIQINEGDVSDNKNSDLYVN